MSTTHTENFLVVKAAMVNNFVDKIPPSITDKVQQDPLMAAALAGGGLGAAHSLLSKNDEDDYGERPIKKLVGNTALGGAAGVLAGFIGTRMGPKFREYLESKQGMPNPMDALG